MKTLSEKLKELTDKNPIKTIESGICKRKSDNMMFRYLKTNIAPHILCIHGEAYDAYGFDIIYIDSQQN